MELKEGMYVRTKHGIRKIIEIDEDNNQYIDKTYVNDFRQEINCISDSCIIGEPSFNIIDLIEEEDYVNDYYVTTGNQNVGSIYIAEINGLGLKRKLYNKDIQSIVTKEQFEEISYKIGVQ